MAHFALGTCLDKTKGLLEKDYLLNFAIQESQFDIHMMHMPPFLCNNGNKNVHC
jgi:hypothetical protein